VETLLLFYSALADIYYEYCGINISSQHMFLACSIPAGVAMLRSNSRSWLSKLFASSATCALALVFTNPTEAGVICLDNGSPVSCVGAPPNSTGLIEQQPNGSGGSDAYVAGNADGGDNGATGDAVDVNFQNGFIGTTAGDTGLYGESIGGKGGNGGDVIGVGGDGGDGGHGGSGGAVAVTNNATIQNSGNFGTGIFALSLGGAGGNGGDSDTAFAGSGGNAGAGGQGGAVQVTNNVWVVTDGDQAVGILGQSLGGHGGSGGDGGGIYGQGGSGNPAGAGGTVTILNNGLDYTFGTNSAAIVAQSIGGFSGSGGSGAGI